MPKDKVYKLLLNEIGPDSPVQGVSADAPSINSPQAMQDLTTAYITTRYYSALSNLYLQGLLPKNMEDIDNEMPRFKIVFQRTYTDFAAATAWLSKNGGEFIAASPAKQYYDEIQNMGEDAVMDIPTAYSQTN